MKSPLALRRAIVVPAELMLIVVGTSFGACSKTSPPGSAVPMTVKAKGGALDLLEQFWAAASAGDSVAMQRHVAGQAPMEWAAYWGAAYPGFFAQTAGKLKIQGGYYSHTRPDSAQVTIRVPWVSCPPPAHEGNPDRYNVELISTGDGWLISAIWRDIC